jgi:hypothetical protein
MRLFEFTTYPKPLQQAPFGEAHFGCGYIENFAKGGVAFNVFKG